MIKITSLLTLFVMAAILVSMNTSTSFAQNNALSQSGNSKAEQAIEQAQSSSQDSQCVSGDITALSCNNIGLQVQRNGDGDGNNPKPPVPPSEKGCPADETLWDVTVDALPENDNQNPGVPVGTVVCLTEDRPGTQDAFVVFEGQSEAVPATANPNQFNDDPNCNGAGQQLAHVTSGVPPQQLQMGSPLCVDVTNLPPT